MPDMTTRNNGGPADPSAHVPRELPEPAAWLYVEDPFGANEHHWMLDSPESQGCDPREWTPLYTADQMREAVAAERVQRTRPAPMASSAIARCMIRVSDPLLWGRMGDGCGVLAEEFARAIEHECHEHITQRASAQPGQTAAARDVLAERRRQIEAEGWTPEHDDSHTWGQLSLAAACYVFADDALSEAPPEWPWASGWWKPSDNERRNLVKAGALILAEIERLDRKNSHEGGSNG